MDKLLITKLITTAVIIAVSILIYFILSKIIKKVFNFKTKISKKKQNTLMNFFLNVAKVLCILVAVLTILSIFGIDTKTFIASLGVVTVVIGLAFQDLLKDIIAGVALVFENSYNVGDWVTINNFKGEVISMGIKATRLKAYTGEILIINNGAITEVINHSALDAKVIVDVNVAYETDVNKALKVLNDLCIRLTKQLPNLKSDLSVLGIEDLGDSAVTIRLIADVEAGCQFDTQREIRKQVKLELDKNNITIPYNQLVIHNE